jgi:hypothetical protein
MAARSTTPKSTLARRVTPKAAAARAAKASPKRAYAVKKSAAPKRAPAPINRTSAMLKDIRARGEQLTTEINDLLHHLG